MKKISILGSTGSIGTQALQVMDRHPGVFQVTSLTAGRNVSLLSRQAKKYGPRAVCIAEEKLYDALKSALSGENIEVLGGREGLLEIAGRDDADIMLNGLVGAPGMEPTVAAIKAGVDVALSNKESMVMAGKLINSLLLKHGVRLFPVDSEHSAIWQCLAGEKMSQVQKLILTGSGGPFRKRAAETFENITPEEALRHPNWAMGAKITIDSATMMNKGLEVIEARWLFDISTNRIEIVVHPQSIIHSMVEFADGSVKAQLGLPDMKIPIQYALTYPDHAPVSWESLDLAQIGTLTFEKPDMEKFRCIRLAYDALNAGGTASAVLNVANDLLVYAFLDGKIRFTDIPAFIESALNSVEHTDDPDLEVLEEISLSTRNFIQSKLKE